MLGLIGKKVGMTQYYKESGLLCPATAIEVGPCSIIQVKSEDSKDGYNAIKLGFMTSDKVSKPNQGMCKKAGVDPVRHMKEFRLDSTADYTQGTILTAEIFEVGEKVHVRGTMKGRGFAGVTKRHGFKGGDRTHGCRANRIPGSIGASADPSRVFKGKKMPGHYGAKAVSTKGLEVLHVDPEKNIILVKGAVPGPNRGMVYVSKQK